MSGHQGGTKQAPQRKLVKKGLFAKDLAPMMYGFGDDTPAPDTIAMMEELVVDHITDICIQAHRVSTNRGKIKVDDFRFALRNDPKKLARLDELLFMQEEIARARRGFDNSFNDYANDEDLAAARADVAAGIGTLGGPASNATGAAGGAPSVGAGAASKKPALSANPSANGGLALPGAGTSSKAKGKQKA
ncbi:hypothetical protein JCM10908_006127 [Rhodotorula pacifica]|uniref:uncharacterized protein n=1 Tax=Rhodotorula pacifica TaxID=1495444 RepID=UPI00317843F3